MAPPHFSLLRWWIVQTLEKALLQVFEQQTFCCVLTGWGVWRKIALVSFCKDNNFIRLELNLSSCNLNYLFTGHIFRYGHIEGKVITM